jgi:hypothetical protein
MQLVRLLGVSRGLGDGLGITVYEMIRLIESKDAIRIQSPMRVGQRVLFLAFSLVPLLAPYELLIRPHWHGYVNVFFLFVVIVSVGALAVSAFLVWVALAGLSSEVTFDRARGTVTYSADAPIVRWRSIQCALRDIDRLLIEEHVWSDGSPSYSLVTRMVDGETFKSGSSWCREEVDDAIRKVVSFLGLRA